MAKKPQSPAKEDRLYLTNEQVVSSAAAMKVLADTEMPFKVSYIVSKAWRRLVRDYNDIQALKGELMRRHGGEPVDEQKLVASPDFNAEMSALMGMSDNDYTEVFRLPASMLEGVSVTPRVLASLEWFILEDA